MGYDGSLQMWADCCQLSFKSCFILRRNDLPSSGLTLDHPLSGPAGARDVQFTKEVARGPGGLTSWNEHSGDSVHEGLVWTACWTVSSSAGGCGWGCSGGSCFPLLLQHSSLCWGNACGCCKPEEAVLVTVTVPHLCPGAD